jgi:hydroxymethylbilane synthase
LNKLTIGTRGSRLAIIQAGMVKEALIRANPALAVDLKIIKTKGDLVTDIPLEKIGDKGLFIKELENALLGEEIDFAVHSMKDMPTALPAGLRIAAMLPREKPWDVLIARKAGLKLDDMEPGSRIGSSSLRRRAQLQHNYPALQICSVRGNLDTRLRKLEEGQFDGIILAYAGVVRMGWLERITEIIPETICLPAVGQGAIGVEVRADDKVSLELAASLNCSQTSAVVEAERAFMNRLEGGCQVPIGALGEISGGTLTLKGMVASLDGSVIFRAEKYGDPARPGELGTALAEDLIRQGCKEILDQIRMECANDE